MKRRTIIWGFLVLLAVFCTVAILDGVVPYLRFKRYAPQQGDLIFQSLPRMDLVVAIEGTTGSPYSHCGIVIERDGDWFVLEAIGPVKRTPLDQWVKRGRDRGFAVYRLREQFRSKIPDFLAAASKYLGRPYDSRYRMDDERIYCSELIYKAYEDATGLSLADLQTLGSLNWKPYDKTIRKYEDAEPPLDREMITPLQITKSSMVQEVLRIGIQPIAPLEPPHRASAVNAVD